MERSDLALSMAVCFLVQALWLIPALYAHNGNETDRLSLLALKAKIVDSPLGLLSSWNESVHFCSWPGVTCSHRQRVTALDLPSWHLKGQLSPYIGNLSFLRTLNLTNNSFNHEIPQDIGRLFRLHVLNLQRNSFSGKIPANISRCSSLRDLDMVYNNLEGEIPVTLGNLSSLLILNLGGNPLVRGKIPYSLGQLKALKRLVLGDNNLTGTIPPSLYNISTIEFFAVNNNQLEGTLPPNLGHMLPNLQYFYFSSNNFSGSIPATISNASNLVLFQISFNYFTGEVPSLSRSSNLQTLGLFSNSLGYAKNGDLNFVNDLVNCTSLHSLGLGYNNFGGAIPETIGNITRLKRLSFGGNQISGNIPIGIGNLVSLEILALDHNHLTGPIPSTIGKLRKMYTLFVHENDLSGTIPSAMQNLTQLGKLNLAMNNIQGSIPPSLGECMNLQELNLSKNNLSGPIPSQVLSLPSLSVALDISRNQLTGSIPMEVGKLVNLGRLDISENKLSGEIPNTLGSCTSMEYVYLQGNFLRGHIPDELRSLRGVKKLDLSRNKLSGKILNYFVDLHGLDYLNLSFNDFEGPIPQQGIFQNTSKFSVMGNTRLCGGLPELKLQTCTSNVHKNHKLYSKIKYILLACAVVGLIIFLFLVFMLIHSRKRSKPILETSVGISLPRVTYGDLFKATDGFSLENLIGHGSFASVYKGILNQEDTRVAVKVFNLQVSHALKSFVGECESLRLIKHRNLVKILTVCSSIDFQGNDFKALVYDFMENGNLEDWLHSSQTRINTNKEQSQSCGLNLIQRVNIAGDVASALEYMHNNCPETIAHCDIKPSNILLDRDMVAHVGDFGLAKLLRTAFSTSSNQSSSTGVRGTVGYVAPEYAMGSEVSTLGDIYSFGILLLEMFTGKRPTDSMFIDDFNLNNFASVALPERTSEIADAMLLEEVQHSSANNIHGYRNKDRAMHKSLVSIFEIGVACSSAFPVERRNIGDVAAELRGIRDVLDAHRMPRNRARNA